MHARGVEGGAGSGVVQLAQRDVGPADVGGAGLGEQPGLEDHGGQAQRGLVRGGVEGGHSDEIPQGLDGARRLAAAVQPGGEVRAVQRRVGGVEPAQRDRGAADLGPLGEREVRVGGETGRQVQRYGQRSAAQPAEPGPSGAVADVEDGHVQPVLEGGGQVLRADPLQKPLVGGAAAQVDVLAVVDGQLAAAEGEGEAAQARAAFEQGDPQAGVGELEAEP
ncbi:hypothetical protein GCM10020000_14420 [Streptomyces olivoverticillatus]